MSDESKKLTARLRKLRGGWRRNLALRALLLALATGLAALLLLGILDLLFALPPALRIAGLLATAVGAGTVLIRGLLRGARISLAETAARADRLSESRGRPVLSGFELSAEGAGSGLGGFLAGRAVGEAGTQLKELPTANWLPRRPTGRATGILALPALALAVCAIVFPEPSRSVAKRLLNPTADTPPYSHLRLDVENTAPEVVYGDDATLTVAVLGGEPDEPVRFAARRGGKVSESACFAAGGGRYSQRLENVVAPVEFSFRCGRARSHWYKVEVLTQPKFAAALAKLQPPAYSALPTREFAAGEEPLAGLAGSSVELTVTSNRPLASGSLSLLDPEGLSGAPLEEVAATPTGDGTLRFRWTLTRTADIEIQISDIAGTPATEPLRLRQRRLTDAPPEADIASPGAYALATPESEIPLEARASDDYGLRSVDLVRGIGAYRQRVRGLEVGGSGQFGAKIDLGAIGAEAGQTLEYFLEATDHNPDLSGIGASAPVRVEIISTDEYRDLLRARTSISDFTARYRAAEGAMTRLERAVRELEKAGRDHPGDAEKTEPLLKEALRANRSAADLMQKLARDFAAYDLEQELIDRAQEMWLLLNKSGLKLGNIEPGEPDVAERAAEVLELIAPGAEAIAGQAQQAEDVAKVAEIMRLAVRFRRLAADAELARTRLRRFADNPGYHAPRLLKSLAAEAQRLADEFEDLRKELPPGANELPEDFADLAEDAKEFAEAMGEGAASPALRDAASSAGGAEGAEAHHHATRAAEALEALLGLAGDPENPMPEDNAFAALARGGTNNLKTPPDLKQTLEQMLLALTRRLGGGEEGQGQGQPGGGGGGFGGDANGAGGGATALNIPLFGPDRLQFAPGEGSGSGSGQGGGAGTDGGSGEGAGNSRVGSSGTLPQGTNEEGQKLGFSPEEIPEKYRDAVRRYLSKES